MTVDVRDIGIGKGERTLVRLELADDVRDDADGDQDGPVQGVGENDLDGRELPPRHCSITLCDCHLVVGMAQLLYHKVQTRAKVESGDGVRVEGGFGGLGPGKDQIVQEERLGAGLMVSTVVYSYC